MTGEPSEPWMRDAACRGEPTDLWFVSPGADASPAKRVCASCPVREECLDFAIREGIWAGVWGGMAARERRRYARQQGRVATTRCDRCRRVFTKTYGGDRYCSEACARAARRVSSARSYQRSRVDA